MKLILVSVLVLFSLLSGCVFTKSENKTIETKVKNVREIAWNSLTQSEKEEVIGEWKDAKVSKVVADTKRFHLVDYSYEGKKLTMVMFHSTKSKLLGDISKLIDETSQKVVGGGYRD